MAIVFEDLCRDEVESMGKIKAGFLLNVFSDLLVNIFKQHFNMLKKQGLEKYLKNTLSFNNYNIVGLILLSPILILTAIDFVSRITQMDLAHYNRLVYNLLSKTFLYKYPVLLTWAIIFPILAVILNLVPLFKTKKRFVTFAILILGLGFIAMIRLHDFVPCVVHGVFDRGVNQILPIINYCKSA